MSVILGKRTGSITLTLLGSDRPPVFTTHTLSFAKPILNGDAQTVLVAISVNVFSSETITKFAVLLTRNKRLALGIGDRTSGVGDLTHFTGHTVPKLDKWKPMPGPNLRTILAGVVP